MKLFSSSQEVFHARYPLEYGGVLPLERLETMQDVMGLELIGNKYQSFK